MVHNQPHPFPLSIVSSPCLNPLKSANSKQTSPHPQSPSFVHPFIRSPSLPSIQLRAGTASKSIHSTSPVGYRSGRDWDAGITSTSSTNNGTSSSGYRSGLKSGYGQEEDSPRSGGSRKEGE